MTKAKTDSATCTNPIYSYPQSSKAHHSTKRSTLKLLSLGVVGALSASYDVSVNAAVLEEIVVTAQKRETSLQSTPIAVTAFGQDALDDIGAINIQDLIEAVPSLHTSRDSNGAVQITLRGITSTNNTELGDPAVSFNVDGIYMARPQAASALMFDVERVEVLRGPQGTLFGRNSPAGAINLVTKKPGQEMEGSVGVLVGDYGRYLLQGAVTTPISDTFSLRFSGMTEKRDSFNTPGSGTPVSVADDEMPDTRDDLAGRVSALWKPSNELSWLLTFDYLNSGSLPALAIESATGPKVSDIRTRDVEGPSTFDMDTTSLRSKIDWNFSDSVGLSYLTSFNSLETERFTRVGGNQYAYRDNESTTHEIQLKSIDPSAKLEWIVGAFYFKEKNITDFQVTTFPTGGIRFDQPDRTSEAQAVFGQATYHMTDQLGLTLGIRQSEDEKEDVGGENQDCGAPFPFGGNPANWFFPEDLGTGEAERVCALPDGADPNTRKNDWSATTWRVQVDYDAGGAFYYGSISTGYKAGGFGDATSADYDEENLINYELGIKADLMDGRLRLNSALFFSDYEDLQVSSVEGSGDPNGAAAAVTRNAGEAEITGLEVEFIWLPTDNSRIQGFVAYMDAELTSFPGAVDSAFGGAADAFDASGNTLPYTSDLSASVAYDVDIEVGDGAILRPRLSVSWRDDYWMRAVNRPVVDLQDSHTIVDASLRYTSADERWSAEVFGKNLTDEEVAISADSVGPGGNNLLEYTYKPPRIWGVRFDYNF